MQREGRAVFDRRLRALVRRLWIAHLLQAAAIGILAAAALFAIRSPVVLGVLAGAAGAAIWLATRRGDRSRTHAALVLERAVPASRNVIVTAEELLAHPERASEWMREAVVEQAAGLTAATPLDQARSLRWPLTMLALAVCVASLPFWVPRPIAVGSGNVDGHKAVSGGGVSLDVTIEWPPYTGRATTHVADPTRIDALEGSTLRLALAGATEGWRLRFGSEPIPLDGRSSAALRVRESGYVAVEPPAGGATGARLIPLNVTPDRAPTVRIEAPARDLLMPDATRTVPVNASASDDLGLASLELRYTKVSGTGEDFEFVEGTLPVRVARADGQAWTAAGEIPLASLDLGPGDSLVYRAVARDGRPGATGEAASDTFFVEIAGPGQVAFDGFALPPEQERYALSQQMIVVKIERLRARETTLAREAVRDAAAAIAAEQRAVRANFIFLMGGHVEDEEVEAEQSHEIQEGRLENSARREISTAIHLMTRAEQGLVAISTASALPPARQAVEALQRAFGHNRYILRTPPARVEIDPGRRLAGTLSSASSWYREGVEPPRDDRARRADAFVEAALAVARNVSAGQSVDRASLQALAERALAVDPASRQWQQVSAQVAAVLTLVSDGGGARAIVTALGEAIRPAVALAAQGGLAPPAAGTSRPGSLQRAWSDQVRR